MKPEEIEQVEEGVQLLPMTAGAVVLAYNLDGVENLKLSRDAYIGIFLGKVTKWNDKLIADANSGVSLPDSTINVIVRADSSGTTFVFTKHLAEVSSEFNDTVGVNKQPNWPGSNVTKSKGNEGVTASLNSTPGSIGYVEYGYAKLTNLTMATLENKNGKFVEPAIPAFQATLAGIEMPEDLIAWAPDPEGDESYPIVTYTWLLCYKQYPQDKGAALKDVLNYCLTEGQKSSEELGYIPLPDAVTEQVKAAMDNIQVGG
jgi:phosphate transport system substrate-binding protein